MNSANEFNRQAYEISPTTAQLTRSLCALVACFLLAAHVTADEPKPNPAVANPNGANSNVAKAAFEKAAASSAWAVTVSRESRDFSVKFAGERQRMNEAQVWRR